MLLGAAAKTVLLSIGGPMELIGIALVALHILAPTFRTAVGAATRTKQRMLERIQNAFAHFRGELHRVVSSREMPIDTTEGATVIKKPDRDASPEEALRFLVEVSAETQERLNRLETQLAGLRDQTQRGLDDVRRQFERAIDQAVSESELAYLRWRVLGFALALIGATAVLVASMM